MSIDFLHGVEEPRLKNQELLPVLSEFLEGSAFLPSTTEFSTFWAAVLGRLRSEDGWAEEKMHDYLLSNLLSQEGDVLSSSWRSGLGSVPVGYSTYAPNSIERCWRLLKGLLKPGCGFGKESCLKH